MSKRKRFELWSVLSTAIFCVLILFLIYPMFMLLRESVWTPADGFTIKNFVKFFSSSYYYGTILNSFKIALSVTLLSLLIGIPFSYFYSFYQLKGRKLLLVLSVLCCMSAPFIGAYSWILMMGRSGFITTFFKNVLHINLGSIYGFKGILLTQTTKLFPLVFIYMNGAFRNIDSSLIEASSSLGSSKSKQFLEITLRLTTPTLLAAALLVFMRSLADFGTPMVIGEGYRTFPVEIYNQFLAETGADFGFASAISVIAIVLTGLIFLLQKYTTKKFEFTMSALHPVEPKKAKGLAGVLVNLYCYIVVGISILPQVYIVGLSFRNYKNSVRLDGYSFKNYADALKRGLRTATVNSAVYGITALLLIIILAVFVAYLVVRRPNVLNHTIDTVSMLPYIMPGTVVGIALVIAFNKKPFVLTGTMAIIVVALVIRRLPYTVRSATATLMQIPLSVEEASISLGASKLKTFVRITVPMMKNGIISGAILSWVAIITEISASIILYNNKTITLTVGTYTSIVRGMTGTGAVFAAITTVLTVISMIIYLRVSKTEDIKL